MRVRVRRGGGRARRATLTIDPAGVTAQVVLLLPDRQAVLDLVDDVTAGSEGLVAVRRAHPHPYRQLADREITEPVHAGGARHAEAAERLRHDALAFAHRQCFEGFVLETPHGRALVVIAYPALERRVAAAGGIGELRAQPPRLDGRTDEAEGA